MLGLLVSVLLVVVLFPPFASSTESSSHAECQLYLAPSTIPGAGLGIFAGSKAFDKGETIALGDLVLSLQDIAWHNGKYFPDFYSSLLTDVYTWDTSDISGMEEEIDDAEYMTVLAAGFGAAVNFHIPLVNVKDLGDPPMSNAGLSSESPGVGAFTPYHGNQVWADTDIPPGMELFLSYGADYWSSRRKEVPWMPMAEDFESADQILRHFLQVLVFDNGTERRRMALSDNSAKSSSRTIVQSSSADDGGVFSDVWILLQDVKSIWSSSPVLNALPGMQGSVGGTKITNAATIEAFLASGGTANRDYNRSIRSLDWLEEHGHCMDNIRDGISDIPHAGRGAFAHRYMSKGTIVAPAPLIHIPDRASLLMYNEVTTLQQDTNRTTEENTGTTEEDTRMMDEYSVKIRRKRPAPKWSHGPRGEFVGRIPNPTSFFTKEATNTTEEREVVMLGGRNVSAPYSSQLLLNYCFGHGESTLLLCSYGAMTWHINHSPHPNVKIEWSQNRTMYHPEWMDQPISEWGATMKVGLQFNIVALRDIDEGEELLLDYGPEWEQAWEKHVEDFNRNVVGSRKHYVPAFVLNQMDQVAIRTCYERRYGLDHVNLNIHQDYLFNDYHAQAAVLSAMNSSSLSTTTTLQHHVVDSFARVIQRTHDDSYVVELSLLRRFPDGRLEVAEPGVVVLWDLPRSAFVFEDFPFTRDHNQPWAFRHDMRIPDELFPIAWRNKVAPPTTPPTTQQCSSDAQSGAM